MKHQTRQAPGQDRSQAYTRHALVRMQQRRVPANIVDLLFAYGDEVRTRHGYILYCGKHARRRVARHHAPSSLSNLERYLSCYLIESDDGKVVTVGYRHKRIRRMH